MAHMAITAGTTAAAITTNTASTSARNINIDIDGT
jgi:hypothetical protein